MKIKTACLGTTCDPPADDTLGNAARVQPRPSALCKTPQFLSFAHVRPPSGPLSSFGPADGQSACRPRPLGSQRLRPQRCSVSAPPSWPPPLLPPSSPSPFSSPLHLRNHQVGFRIPSLPPHANPLPPGGTPPLSSSSLPKRGRKIPAPRERCATTPHAEPSVRTLSGAGTRLARTRQQLEEPAHAGCRWSPWRRGHEQRQRRPRRGFHRAGGSEDSQTSK